MIIDGIALALLDVPDDARAAYHRWYELDHLPEHLAKPDVVTATRYLHCTVDGLETGDLDGICFATMYWLGGVQDFDDDEVLARWAETDRRLTKEGRFWRDVRVVRASRWRLRSAESRASISASEQAIPHLGHVGVVLSFGRHPAGGREVAARWWRETQQRELLDVAGVAAILEFEPADGSDELLHVLMCTAEVRAVTDGIRAMRAVHRLVGRYPAFKGEYETTAILPFERLSPLGGS